MQTNKKYNGECEEQDKEDEHDADDRQHDGAQSLCATLFVALRSHHASSCQTDDRHQNGYYVTDQVQVPDDQASCPQLYTEAALVEYESHFLCFW